MRLRSEEKHQDNICTQCTAKLKRAPQHKKKKKYWKKKTNQEQHQSHQTSVEHSSIKTSTRISRQYERRQESGIYVHAILFSPTSLWLQLFPFFYYAIRPLNLFFHCFIFFFSFSIYLNALHLLLVFKFIIGFKSKTIYRHVKISFVIRLIQNAVIVDESTYFFFFFSFCFCEPSYALCAVVASSHKYTLHNESLGSECGVYLNDHNVTVNATMLPVNQYNKHVCNEHTKLGTRILKNEEMQTSIATEIALCQSRKKEWPMQSFNLSLFRTLSISFYVK